MTLAGAAHELLYGTGRAASALPATTGLPQSTTGWPTVLTPPGQVGSTPVPSLVVPEATARGIGAPSQAPALQSPGSLLPIATQSTGNPAQDELRRMMQALGSGGTLAERFARGGAPIGPAYGEGPDWQA